MDSSRKSRCLPAIALWAGPRENTRNYNWKLKSCDEPLQSTFARQPHPIPLVTDKALIRLKRSVRPAAGLVRRDAEGKRAHLAMTEEGRAGQSSRRRNAIAPRFAMLEGAARLGARLRAPGEGTTEGTAPGGQRGSALSPRSFAAR